SFSGDGLLQHGEAAIERAVAQARRFVAEGADCLDVGGMSTRPGHALVDVEEELARVIPVIRALAQEVNVPISVDTFRAKVAQAALAAGAHLLNDVWGLRFDPDLAAIAAQAFAPLIVMDNRMQPADPAYAAAVQAAQHGPSQGDLIQDIRQQLAVALAKAEAAGLPRWLQIVDPGIGFGKTLEQHLELIRRLDELTAWGYPLLFGPSRKSFIGKVLGDLPPEQRLEGTLSACVMAIERGANLLRVHDVQAIARGARFADAVLRPKAAKTEG
ncbi:MAG TPA: dihydropteroate synthase, partial [Caldilineaceae bacterium]|nr:dihydropteroate synthase [Caldilineaceae bacterium]